jgi:hypothetical protein
MRVINLWGGPGTGKSTTAAGLFFEMKRQGFEVELVTEYAKDMTWEKRTNVLTDQLYILAKQNRRIQRLDGQVDFVVTDSPLPLGLVYQPDDYYSKFAPLAWQVWNSYTNVNFKLGRDFEYQTAGRNQSYDEALCIDDCIHKLLQDNGVKYERIIHEEGNDRTTQIMRHLGLSM